MILTLKDIEKVQKQLDRLKARCEALNNKEITL